VEWQGFKIDLIGVAAVITAIAALVSKIKATRNKEKTDARKTDSFKPFV
jgi:hypothetical protein